MKALDETIKDTWKVAPVGCRDSLSDIHERERKHETDDVLIRSYAPAPETPAKIKAIVGGGV